MLTEEREVGLEREGLRLGRDVDTANYRLLSHQLLNEFD